MTRYAITIFLSAFLLFQVQPLISKRILPWFGGTPMVWTTCMMFFQVALLAGYAYAHFLSTHASRRRQVTIHLILLAAALAFLPVYPGASWKPGDADAPTLRIVLLLAATVGLPYFVLSATSPLLQKWFTLENPGRSAYRLYALSNAGSLLALGTYPFLVEPNMVSRNQALAWSAGFAAFCVACGICAIMLWRRGDDARASTSATTMAEEPGQSPTWFRRVLWVLLAANGSIILLAVTNQMCMDVAVIPFLWVLPLALYLVSFIICFDNEKWFYRPVFWPVMAAGVAGMWWVMGNGASENIFVQVGVYSLGVLACCMVSHGELARLKPQSRSLTSFYLALSAGGALGGIFVTLIAPRVFPIYLELQAGIWSCCAVAITALLYQARHWLKRRNWFFRCAIPAASVGALALLGGTLVRQVGSLKGYVSITRNFYGVLRVADAHPDDPLNHRFELIHGRIIHGFQYVCVERRHTQTSYYGTESGIGLALRNHPRNSALRVGLVGLGAGTLAAYGQAGDYYRFYEINPSVVRLAHTYFTYLADSLATCEIALGDARLSLEREEPQRFDVLALDAFSSDAIPVHLLTREAFETYLKHLNPDGVLAVHISNHHLDLEPVVRAAADALGLYVVRVNSSGSSDDVTFIAAWMLLSRDADMLDIEPIQASVAIPSNLERKILWTDDYSSLFPILTARER